LSGNPDFGGIQMTHVNKLEAEYIQMLEKIKLDVGKQIDGEGRERICGVVPFEPSYKETNSVFKGLDVYAWGVPNKIFGNPKHLVNTMFDVATSSNAHIDTYTIKLFKPQGLSIDFLLYESNLNLHTWPEKNHLDFYEGTCGSDTHPIKGFRSLLNKIETVCGYATYWKSGHDDVNKESIFVKDITKLVSKYRDQFDTDKYVFNAQRTYRLNPITNLIEPFKFRYDIVYCDPNRIEDIKEGVQKSESGPEWLHMKNWKKGIYLEGKLFEAA
jgi:S-adenosylmethionine/arginine decarboxylase-like enzyme